MVLAVDPGINQAHVAIIWVINPILILISSYIQWIQKNTAVKSRLNQSQQSIKYGHENACKKENFVYKNSRGFLVKID